MHLFIDKDILENRIWKLIIFIPYLCVQTITERECMCLQGPPCEDHWPGPTLYFAFYTMSNHSGVFTLRFA